MKTKTLLTILTGTILIFSSCEKIGNYVTPSGTVRTEKKDITNYSGIDVSNAFNVYINFSDTEQNIEIEANENLHEYIIVEKSGDKLIIKIKDNINIRSGDATLNAYITTNNLSDIKASGATDIVLRNNLRASAAFIELSGASSLMGSIVVEDLKCDISGASNINVSGNATKLKVDASGASSVKSYELNVNDLNMDLSGASSAQLSVNNKIDIEASGASTLLYKGNPRINSQDLSGASSIKRVN